MSWEGDNCMVCKTCSLLVRSTREHFNLFSHEDFRIPKADGSLNLVCRDCNASFRQLAEAVLHMKKSEGHTNLYETPMDDDGQVSATISMDLAKPTKTGVELMDTGSVSSLITARSNVRAARTLHYLGVSKEDAAWLKDKYVLVEDTEPVVVLKKIDQLLRECQVTEGLITFNLTNVNQKKTNKYEFEKILEQLCLIKTTLCCSSQNGKQTEKVNRLYKMLLEFKSLLEQRRTMCLHQIPYTNKDMYVAQRKSDSDVDEICAMLGVNRESLSVYTEPTGSIMGPVLLYTGEKLLLDCEFGGLAGNKIPAEAHKLTTITFKFKKPIDFILLVEKQTILQALSNLGFANKHNCLLISGGGQPSVTTRVMLRRLMDLLNVPIYGLFDGNPAGAVMYATYKYGSEGKAFDGICLTVPNLIWIGMFPEDVDQMYRTTMSSDTLGGAIDPRMKALEEFADKADEYYGHDNFLLAKLSTMMMDREVADVDILTRHYDLEEHILRKIKDAPVLPAQGTGSSKNSRKRFAKNSKKRRRADAS